MPGTLVHVKLGGECHLRNSPGAEEEVGLLQPSQHKVNSRSLEAHLAVATGTSLQKCRAAGGTRPSVIGGTLLVGIMNLVVSAEVIGRALLQ